MQRMKKLIFPAILAIFFSLSSINLAQAQSDINLPDQFELGIRLGDTFGSSFAIDAMMPLWGETLHADVGFDDGLAISALYDFKSTIVDSFYWYFGVGGELGLFDDFTLAAAGEIGVEYAIQDFPITFGVDYRPAIGLIGRDDFISGQYGFNIRYRF